MFFPLLTTAADRKYRFPVILGLLAALFAGLYFLTTRRGAEFGKINVVTSGLNDRTSLESASNQTTIEKFSSLQAKPENLLSPAELQDVQLRLENVEAEFQHMESANTKTIAEISEDEGLVVVSMITTPTLVEYRAYVDAIASAMDGLPDSIRDAAYDLRKEMLDRYVSCPTPFRVVQGYFPYETSDKNVKPKRSVAFSEEYVFNENAVTISDDGTVGYTGGGVGGRGFGADGGLSRYGYLFAKYLPATGTGRVQK